MRRIVTIETMDEDKKKEWLVGRIDSILDGILEQTKQQESEFDFERTKITKSQREIQKTILILLGIGISIILGASQTEFDKIISGIILMWFSVTMVFLFISSVFYDHYLSKILNGLRKAYQFQTGHMSHIKGDFLQLSTQLENHTSDQLQTYVNFCWVASASAQLSTLRAYEKVYNSKQGYRSFRKHSEDRLSEIKNVLKLGISVYDKRIDEFKNETLLNLVINRLKPLEDYRNEKTESKKKLKT